MNNIYSLSPTPSLCSSSAFDHQEILADVIDQVRVLNAAIAKAVDAGLTIELTRACRHHSERSTWGDQVSATVRPA